MLKIAIRAAVTMAIIGLTVAYFGWLHRQDMKREAMFDQCIVELDKKYGQGNWDMNMHLECYKSKSTPR